MGAAFFVWGSACPRLGNWELFVAYRPPSSIGEAPTPSPLEGEGTGDQDREAGWL